ncbi:MAG TPA: medium chain dehydrogenase/reductase family protein [Desertimonas sp.]|nr:medium chain dehydrogenase/reductase family protein [Desertimonas sp.]
MKALEMHRSVPRLGLARIASAIGASTAARVAPLEYRTVDPPELPGDGWHRVRTRLSGICGSDLSMIEGHASMYFDDVVSFPFVPGHEVVGELADGTRVAIEPVLGHAARGFAVPFEGAAPGDGDDYGHLIAGDLEPGIQTGFCSSTGGGWAPEFVAHDSQLHRLGDVPDERAVLIEPLAGGIHAALLAARGESVRAADPPLVVVLGAGTMGLAAIAGLVRYVPDATVVVGARYPHQQREARRLGAHDVVPAAELTRAVRRHDGCRMIGEAVSGGAHAVVDAVGSAESIATALRITRPRGRTVLMGMPAEVTLDLTGLWHRETELVGAYTYGTEQLPDGTAATTFDLAADTAAAIEAERWLSATYRLVDHVDAIAHAANAGRRGAIKVAFDLREKA